MAALSVLLSTPAIARLSLQTVEAEGSGVTRQEAILDALQWAVGQVNGVEVAASVSSQMSEYMTEQNGSVSTTLSSSFLKTLIRRPTVLSKATKLSQKVFLMALHMFRYEHVSVYMISQCNLSASAWLFLTL